MDNKSEIKDFTIGRVHQVTLPLEKAHFQNFYLTFCSPHFAKKVLIIGYEKMRSLARLIQDASIDLVICDEGHRLKNSQIRTAQALKALPTKRRLILSGTPIQNDLEEFHAMLDFVNPGIVGSLGTFKKVFEGPIMKSRDPACSPEDFQLGRERSEELSRLTRLFVLRRTAEVNAAYLPPKQELVVFCRPTELQRRLYRQITESTAISTENALGISLDTQELSDSNDIESMCRLSGKLQTLVQLLNAVKESTSDKVVIVSNWTQTLDIIEQFCKHREYTFLRLDGNTPVQKRQGLVDQFNKPTDSHFLFLLSSKAGGVGLNLTGARRLVLFDIDWNPALDQQAMARVWRDGQRSDVKIYRFLTTGTIEERIYQRQITKQGLSDSLMDEKDTATNNFTAQELKNLFTLDETSDCLTHELLGCECGGAGGTVDKETEKVKVLKTEESKLAALNDWIHLSVPFEEFVSPDTDLGRVIAEQESSLEGPVVSYVFHRTVKAETEAA
ncbi:DNA repair and recombination protein rad54b [Borealophlyctis nickersoniae]|nr:DNA repair and recombination protein rad54b [Borealophlyctis nickersoniae]